MTDKELRAATPEQRARDMLDRMGIKDAQSLTAGDVVEVANLVAELDQLRALLTWCDQHMTEMVPQLPDFSGPDLIWQQTRLLVRRACEESRAKQKTPKAG